jgi:predicted aspartyl protease
MTLTFKYKAVDRPDGEIVKTPSIPITLHGKVFSYDHMALLDSGADVSAMTKEIADLLGLNLSKKTEKTRGIGGEVETIETKVKITISQGHETYTFEIPVNVVLGDEELPLLLGRAGFFENFVITFDENNQRVQLKKSNSINKW